MTKSDEPVGVDAPKWLRNGVYIMGFVLVALFLVLVITIGYKASRYSPAQVEGEKSEIKTLGLGLPPDQQFKDVTLNGDRLMVNTGKTIYVIDVPTQRIILRVNGQQD